MLAMIKKDLFTLRRAGMNQILLAGAMMIMFTFLLKDISFSVGLFVMIAFTSTISTFSYDEFAHLDAYALSMPVSRRELVRAKYVLFFAVLVISSIFSAVCGLLASIFIGGDLLIGIVSIAGVAGIFLFTTALILPFLFKFGAERGRLFLVAAMMPFVVVTLAFSSMDGKMPAFLQLDISIAVLVIGALALLALTFYISYKISVKIYTKREF